MHEDGQGVLKIIFFELIIFIFRVCFVDSLFLWLYGPTADDIELGVMP